MNAHFANIYMYIPTQAHTITFSVRICMSNFNRKNNLFWKIINCWNERLWTKTFQSQIERPSVLTTYSAAIICASQISDWTMDLQQWISKQCHPLLQSCKSPVDFVKKFFPHRNLWKTISLETNPFASDVFFFISKDICMKKSLWFWRVLILA